ncbi:hypothetical protein EBZ39_06235 [bacterium]|nr:hypothetical protein [bacterium]
MNTIAAAIDKAGMANFDGEYAQIPARMQESLRRYVLAGEKPGDFLTAVICNDLCNAVGRADAVNLPLLKLYVQWFYNVAPGLCWGSRENMDEWMTARAQNRFC